MQNIEKRKKEYFNEFIFLRVNQVPNFHILYITIVIINILSDGLLAFQYIISDQYSFHNNLNQFIFYAQGALLAALFIVTILSTCTAFFRSAWIYFLYFLQSLSIFYCRTLSTCFSGVPSSMCSNNTTLQIVHIALFSCLCLVIIILRNNAYYPFQDVSHLFSTRKQNISIYILIFRICFCLVAYRTIPSLPRSSQVKVIALLGIILFWKSRDSGFLNQITKKVWDVYFYFILWTSLTFFLCYYLNLINDFTNLSLINRQLSFRQASISFWLYTFPFVASLSIYGNHFASKDFWKKILDLENHSIQKTYGKEKIYIFCNQFYHLIQNLKHSQMKYKDPEFKNLWQTIKKHNKRCTFESCPLAELEQIEEQNNEQLQEQKKFLKTLKSCLQFARLTLQKLKQSYPNLLELDIEIAYFYLLSFKNKQKGILLYNDLNKKRNKKQEVDNFQQKSTSQSTVSEEILVNKKKNKNNQKVINKSIQSVSSSDIFAVYFLKKKIDHIFVNQQKQNTNAETQMSEFRQKIEVSVTMLAQFWSLLADPKCNLKKMYDLTNVLFPLKMSLQQDWERVKTFKNTQIYAIYAKYLIKMFNDKEKGLKIIQETKKIQLEQKNKNQVELDDKGGQIIQQNGIIFLQFDGKNSGVMFQVNVNAERIFGYNRGELLQKKVNDIMPRIYATRHDRILENYQQTNISTMMNKQRFVWGKSKDGFIFPFTILIKPVLSFYSQSSSSEVYANIKREPYMRELVGIVLDKDEIIQQYTTSALRLFPILIDKYQYSSKNREGYKITKEQNKGMANLSFLSIYDILPNYDQIKNKVLTQNQQYEIKIERAIQSNKNGGSRIIQRCYFHINIVEVVIKTAGKIGWILKLTKTGNSQFVHDEKSVQEQFHQSPQQLKANCKQNDTVKDSKVRFSLDEQQDQQVRKNRRKFIFSYDFADKIKIFEKSYKNLQVSKKVKDSSKPPIHTSVFSQQAKLASSQHKLQRGQVDSILMKFVGGYTRSSQILQKFKNDTLSSFRAQLKVSQIQKQENRVDYSKGIKPKRLMEGQIKQIREQETQIQFKQQKKQEQDKQEQSKQLKNEVKPSQLSLILSKEVKNKNISLLRAITVGLLICVSAISIVQKILIQKSAFHLLYQFQMIRKLGQIKTQVYSLDIFITYLSSFSQDALLNFNDYYTNINQLDQMLDNFTFNSNVSLRYSDGSTQNYYLGFALNKLISEANSVQVTADKLISNTSTSAYFIQHNSVNGIPLSLRTQESFIWSNFIKQHTNLSRITIIFISVASSIVLVIICIQNIILRKVMRKKAEILQIFFQIPRVSCNIIQKQCELFILKLSDQNQEEQMELESFEEEFEEGGRKNEKVQKKRTVVGEENSTFIFSTVSVFLIVFLLFFQIFAISTHAARNQEIINLVNSTSIFYNLENKVIEMVTFISSIAQNSNALILGERDYIPILERLENQIEAEAHLIMNSYYTLQQIFDQSFRGDTTSLYYYEFCDSCDGNKNLSSKQLGLNSIFTNYIAKTKRYYTDLLQCTNQKKHFRLEKEVIKVLKVYQISIKKFWRQLTRLISQSINRYINKHQTEYLWVVVGVCLLNLVFFLLGWMKYYSNLQQKMVATQYILTFIPIDEINKNKKIGKYIAQEIVSRK